MLLVLGLVSKNGYFISFDKWVCSIGGMFIFFMGVLVTFRIWLCELIIRLLDDFVCDVKCFISWWEVEVCRKVGDSM